MENLGVASVGEVMDSGICSLEGVKRWPVVFGCSHVMYLFGKNTEIRVSSSSDQPRT